MATARISDDDRLDVFGQQPGLSIYTQITLCFPLGNPASRSHIISTLTDGLAKLAVGYPWVADQVVNEGATDGNSGVYKFKALEKKPRLVVKDYLDNPAIPGMDELRRANFPSSMLDESIIAPRNTIPSPNDPKEWPVFLVQANFIKGGLLLTFNAHHGAMDMSAQGQVMHLLSKACNGETFSEEEVKIGNLPRGDLIPLLDDLDEQNPEFAHQIVKPLPPPRNPPSPRPKSTWAYFIFSPASLASLKSFASQSTPLPPGGYISTDDALSALIWQSTTRARLPRLDPHTKTTFGRAIDTRRYLDIPLTYLGVAQNMTYHSCTLEKLIKEPLGSIAHQFRLAVDPRTSDLPRTSRAYATLLHRAQHKSTVNVTAAINPSTDITLSSWAHVACYDMDFNLGLGKPEAVRRPQFIPVESLFYLMPKKGDGEVAAALCLREEDLERLRKDEEFMKYATYVG